MIDKKLKYDRQMYALGQRVNFQRGGTGGGTGDAGSPGTNADGSNANSGGNGYNDGRNMANIAGPVTGPPNMSHYGDPDPEVDVPTSKRQDTITSFMDNLKAQFNSMGLKNAIPGASIFNLSKTALQTAKARAMLGLGPAVGPGPTNDDRGGDGQGIMAAYNPYLLSAEEEVPVSQEEEDFIQRFRVANDFRQDKQGQLDPAILEMISKLYT